MYRGVFTSSFQRCFICDTKISGAMQAEAERGIRHGEPERQKWECNSFETSGRSMPDRREGNADIIRQELQTRSRNAKTRTASVQTCSQSAETQCANGEVPPGGSGKRGRKRLTSCQNSISTSTGQWSEPNTSVWMEAPVSLSRRLSDTTK